MNQPDPVRIPIGRNVTYAVRGMPAVPNAYGPGFLVPTEISLTYRAAEDSQLGRFHAYVKGQRLRDGEVVPSGEKLPGQHYYGDPSGWPEWLAEEARLHDPEPAAQSPADRAALRERIAAAIHADLTSTAYRRDGGLLGIVPRLADAVLAVLPEPAEAHRLALSEALHLGNAAPWQAILDRAADLSRRDVEALRRLAAEARAVPLATTCTYCGHRYDEHNRFGCRVGNEVVRCGCDAFVMGEKPAPVDPRTILGIDADVPAPVAQQPAAEAPSIALARQAQEKLVRKLTAAGEQPAQDEARVVAYRNSHRPGILLCRKHGDGWMGLTPLTADDLPDGGICTWNVGDECGVDVLIPQESDRD